MATNCIRSQVSAKWNWYFTWRGRLPVNYALGSCKKSFKYPYSARDYIRLNIEWSSIIYTCLSASRSRLMSHNDRRRVSLAAREIVTLWLVLRTKAGGLLRIDAVIVDKMKYTNYMTITTHEFIHKAHLTIRHPKPHARHAQISTDVYINAITATGQHPNHCVLFNPRSNILTTLSYQNYVLAQRMMQSELACCAIITIK